jgi:hypothetical protein
MKTNKVIENWKNSELNSVIGNSTINKEMMAELQGGTGYVKTLSGECNTKNLSCWQALKNAANAIIEAFS